MDLTRKMKSNIIKNSHTLTNEKAYSSISNNLSWLNQGLAELKNVNIHIKI